MEYKVKITENASQQLNEIVDYIAFSLQAPETALKWIEFLQKEIYALSLMPKAYPIIKDPEITTKEIRKKLVKNFFIYYWISEETETVWVVAIIYGKRSQMPALLDSLNL